MLHFTSTMGINSAVGSVNSITNGRTNRPGSTFPNLVSAFWTLQLSATQYDVTFCATPGPELTKGTETSITVPTR